MKFIARKPVVKTRVYQKYGFVYVDRDFEDLKELKRYPKKSFYWYKKVIESQGKDLENDIDY